LSRLPSIIYKSNICFLGKPSLGLVNPALYAGYKSFAKDITSGNNSCPASRDVNAGCCGQGSLYVCIYMCIFVDVYTYIYVYMDTCMYTLIVVLLVEMSMRGAVVKVINYIIYMFICKYVDIYKHMYMCTCIYMHMLMYINNCPASRDGSR
jgi:hypothetical protein